MTHITYPIQIVKYLTDETSSESDALAETDGELLHADRVDDSRGAE